jgi:UDP-N-acetylmuramoylalanine--D-glutamate ligase
VADPDRLPDIRRALVVGLGTSGRVAVEALADAGIDVVATDERADVDTTGVRADVRPATDPVGLLDGVDLVVPSPGVPEHHAVLLAALERDLPVWSEPELGLRLHPRRLVAVTGTNGKTSVTELLAAMLAAAGTDAVPCGNIGRALTEAAAGSPPDATLVAELSSFQLRFCHELRPAVGVLLNLAPDHLDWHGDLTSYGAAKARIWQAQRGADVAVANQRDEHVLELAHGRAPARLATFDGAGADADGGVTREGDRLVSRVPGAEGVVAELADLVPDAPHHHANVAAAATAALYAGAPLDAVRRAAEAFRPGRHRLERVAELDGVTYVDDSKATNAHAAAAALASFDAVVWVAGGIAKGVDLGVLGPSLGAVRHAVLIGEAADRLAEVCADAGVPHERAGSMETAVAAARAAARPGDTVLLAPACSSFDMFRDYADRGDRFAAAVRGLAPEEVR